MPSQPTEPDDIREHVNRIVACGTQRGNGVECKACVKAVVAIMRDVAALVDRIKAAESQLAEITKERDAERDDNIKQQARLRVGWDKAYDRWKVTKAAHLAAEAEALKQRERADASALALSQIREYAQHAKGCESVSCAVCGNVSEWGTHSWLGYKAHTFTPKSCTCGLSDLLSSPHLPQMTHDAKD